MAFVIASLVCWASPAQAVNLTGATSPTAVGNLLKNPCPKHADHRCWVNGLDVEKLTKGKNDHFQAAWDKWAKDNAGWTLEWSNTGLKGTFNVTQYDIFNACPDPSGIKDFNVSWTKHDDDPSGLKWIQSVCTNEATDGSLISLTDYMDCNATSPRVPPPFYPWDYPSGDFYDGPTRVCIADTTVQWTGYCYLAAQSGKTVKVYEGFRYGFTFSCYGTSVPVPEPSSCVLLFTGAVVMGGILRKTKRS